MDLARTQLDRRHIRYSLVSVVAVVTSQVVLIACNAVLNLNPIVSNFFAVSLGCIPSYYLNRSWVWGKRGRNHFWREVAPFWGMALVGLVFSTLLIALVSRWTHWTPVIMLANLSAFGVLWIVKYMMLDTLLFKIAPDDTSAMVQ